MQIDCFRYTSDICYKTCEQKLITERCGCAYAEVHVLKPHGYDGPYCLSDFCNKSLLHQQIECVNEFYNTLNYDSDCSQCRMPACLQWDFQVSHAMIDYFHHFSAQDFAEDFLAPGHPAIADMIDQYGNLSNVPENFVSKNFVALRVAFADLHVRHRTAQTLMSDYSLVSDLGGAFGFWIGFSVMTFVEILEWFVKMLLSLRLTRKAPVSLAPSSADIKTENKSDIIGVTNLS
mgnify:FL=1